MPKALPAKAMDVSVQLRAVLVAHLQKNPALPAHAAGGALDDVLRTLLAVTSGRLALAARGACRGWREAFDNEQRHSKPELALRVELGRLLVEFLGTGRAHRFEIGPLAAKTKHGLLVRKRHALGLHAVVACRRSARGVAMWSAARGRSHAALPAWELNLGLGIEVLVTDNSVGVYWEGALLAQRGASGLRFVNLEWLTGANTIVVFHGRTQTEHRLSLRL